VPAVTVTYKVLSPTGKQKWRSAATYYCKVAEDNRLRRGYSQLRPGRGYGADPDAIQIDDCSMYASKVSYWSSHTTGYFVADPLNFHYTGIGNTESMQDFLKHEVTGKQYYVGDYALWGRNEWDTTHTAICRKGGKGNVALFSSHGHQSWRFANDAPEAIRLGDFPEYLIGVFRHPQLV
jgi:hypothetical protein